MRKMLWVTVLVLALSTGVVGTAYRLKAKSHPGRVTGRVPCTNR
jgi:hypothetical protein